ncbi:MAG TPA: hypothetical protein VES88_18545 [Gemmatimonadaceae bacterium]|nr:hypothetical protein [Gemmatimonadaceae bacterium]
MPIIVTCSGDSTSTAPENEPETVTQAVGPDGGTVVTPSGAAGVQIPAGTFSQQVMVTITRLPPPSSPGAGPLPTSLKQYGPFYDFTTSPQVAQFGDSARVGVCQVTDPSSSFYAPEPHDQLRLAHTVGSSIEILDRVGVSDFLRCTNVSASRSTRTDRDGWYAALLAIRDNAIGLVRPANLHAAHGGLGGKVKSFSPFGAVEPLLTTPQVSAGDFHTCALKTDGTVVCWGDNTYGQTTVPGGLASVARVTAGGHHTCALKTDGTVVCWGDNTYGEATVPGGLASVAQVSALWLHTCALKIDGTVVCWGNNASGQATVPGGLASVAQVSAGSFHTCALKTDGTVVCWGFNTYGQTTVPGGLASVAQVSAGGLHTCALKTDATVVCWGDNADGETTVPGGLASVAQVSAGVEFTCALKTDGTVVCWGRNTAGQATVPGGLASVAQVSAGGGHTCALKTDGTVVCWGYNFYGQATVPGGLNLHSATNTTLSSAPDSSFFGQWVTFTAAAITTSIASVDKPRARLRSRVRPDERGGGVLLAQQQPQPAELPPPDSRGGSGRDTATGNPKTFARTR